MAVTIEVDHQTSDPGITGVRLLMMICKFVSYVLELCVCINCVYV